MATENVDIRFRETGIRVIKRRIDELGQAANNSTRGIFLMQRALFVLGGAGLLRALVRQVDQLTNYENRLKLTTSSAENLNAVQKELFQVARDSRSSFEAVAEIYTRTALSVKELGVSQQETIQFTESLAKATIISGASAREANAAMIQLGQGMASNTLRGDELRSVLEQLPFVADVIADHFKVTRGELRRLGEEGKISAKDILAAFEEAEDKIDALFANTVPTIEQALVVANVNWLEFLDRADDATSASASVASAIIIISKNVDILAIALGSLAAAWALSFSIKIVQRVANFVTGLKASAIASARLLEVENRRATSFVAHVAGQQAVTAARIADLRQGIFQTAQNKIILTQQKAEQAITIANGRARSVLTGQYVNLTAAKAALNETTKALILTERLETSQRAQLAAVTNTQTAAATRAALANTRLATAQAASTTLTAKLTRSFPLLAGAIALVGRALASLWALIIANPIGAIIVAIALMIAALIKWGNQIKVTQDDVVGMNDAIVAAFELSVEAVQPLIDILGIELKKAVKEVTEFFNQFSIDVSAIMFRVTKSLFNMFAALPRIVIAVVSGIIDVLKILPSESSRIMDLVTGVFVLGFEAMVNNVIDRINLLIKGLNALVEFFGADKAIELFGFSAEIPEIPELQFEGVEKDVRDAAADIAKAFQDGVVDSLDASSLEGIINNFLKPIWAKVIERARQDIAARATAELDPGAGAPDGGIDPEFAKILALMEKQIALLKLTSSERKIGNELLKIEKQLKRDLTGQEEQLATKVIKRLIAAKEEVKVLEAITGPRDQAIRDLATLHRLYTEGRVAVEDYTVALKKMREAADATAGTFMGSFRASISAAVMNTSELGEALGGLIVDAAGRASDAIVEFAQTGKINIREFFSELFAQLMRLLTNQLLLQLLTSFFPGSGLVQAGINIAGPNGHDGGSIMPSGTGSTDTQPVFFNKRPDERVDILTPDQQKRQQQEKSGFLKDGSGQDKELAVTIVNVDDPNKVLDALSTTRGQRVLTNMMQRNPEAFRKALSI